jgi:hypothetical protein
MPTVTAAMDTATTQPTTWTSSGSSKKTQSKNGAPVVAEERLQDHPRRVEGRHDRRQRHHGEQHLVPLGGGHQQLVLGPEAGQRRHAGERGRPDQERPERDRHRSSQATHLAHVVGVTRVDHRPGSEEQQGLEERVGEQVEERGAPTDRSDRHDPHHVGELRHGRIREHPLDVVLHQAEERGAEHGDPADDADHQEHGGVGVPEHLEHPADQVDAGRDHRRGVDQRGDGRRAGHRVREPDVEGELGRLTDRPAEQQQRRQRNQRDRKLAAGHDLADLADVRRLEARRRDQDEDAEHERHVADAGRDERLDRRAGVLVLLPPVPDQQVGAHAHDLPADQELEQVVGRDHVQHRAAEQGENDEEPRVPLVAVHVADRIHVDAQGDRRDHHQHHRGQPVHELPELHVERADLEPVDGPLVRGTAMLNELPEHPERQDEPRCHRRDPVHRSLAGRPPADEQRERGGDERQENDEPHVLHEPVRSGGGLLGLEQDGGYHLRRFTSSRLIVSRFR